MVVSYMRIQKKTIKLLEYVNDKVIDENSLSLIASGVLNSIEDKNVKADFIDLCMKEHSIAL